MWRPAPTAPLAGRKLLVPKTLAFIPLAAKPCFVFSLTSAAWRSNRSSVCSCAPPGGERRAPTRKNSRPLQVLNPTFHFFDNGRALRRRHCSIDAPAKAYSATVASTHRLVVRTSRLGANLAAPCAATTKQRNSIQLLKKTTQADWIIAVW